MSVAFQRQGKVWTAILDRPGKANALTREMLESLADFVEEASATPEVHALVITGNGKVFSAGADLDEARAGLATDGIWERLSGAIAGASILTIAALNGTLAGGAFAIALACDLRICVPGANFFYPVMKLGFQPQPSDPGRMAALIGPARTKMILLAGQKIGAEEALAWGLIDRIVAPEDMAAALDALTADVVAADRNNLAVMKGLLP